MKCASPNALISLIRIPRCQHYELEREEGSEAPIDLPEPPKKKQRTKKVDITSMERIDSYMSNTYLGKMRAAGQIQKAPISRKFFREKQTKEEEKEERREDKREE